MGVDKTIDLTDTERGYLGPSESLQYLVLCAIFQSLTLSWEKKKGRLCLKIMFLPYWQKFSCYRK